MTTKHTVTLPDGTTATRTSANRTYVACIAVGPRDPEVWIASIRGDIRKAEAELAAMEAAIADPKVTKRSRGFYRATDPHSYHDFDAALVGTDLTWHCSIDGEIEDSIDLLGEGRGTIVAASTYMVAYARSQAEYTTGRIADKLARIASIEAGTADLGAWGLYGWQGRLDLAAKEQAKVRGFRTCGEPVVILTEITTVTK